MSTDIVIEKKKTTTSKIKEPGKFKVVVCNDDITPVDFVIAMLISVFNYDNTTAQALTLKVHHEGSAVAGIYTHEIAEQKSIEGISMARNNGFPLILKVVPE